MPYIDVFKLMEYANNMKDKTIDANDIARFPWADVREVKPGRWIRNDNGTYSCRVCQSWIPEEQHYYARYCLHCGARMESREDPSRPFADSVMMGERSDYHGCNCLYADGCEEWEGR